MREYTERQNVNQKIYKPIHFLSGVPKPTKASNYYPGQFSVSTLMATEILKNRPQACMTINTPKERKKKKLKVPVKCNIFN